MRNAVMLSVVGACALLAGCGQGGGSGHFVASGDDENVTVAAFVAVEVSDGEAIGDPVGFEEAGAIWCGG